MIVLRNIFVVKTGDTKIKNDIQHKREIEQCEIKSKVFCVHSILNIEVNNQNVKWLYQQVQKKKKGKICYKFFLHTNILLSLCANIFRKTIIVPVHSSPYKSFCKSLINYF